MSTVANQSFYRQVSWWIADISEPSRACRLSKSRAQAPFPPRGGLRGHGRQMSRWLESGKLLAKGAHRSGAQSDF
jgi:hypothetical protein